MNRTKDTILAAFSALLAERPLNKITVKDIVEHCGINRNTFYYHFADIPSLVEWSAERVADQVIQAYSENSAKTCSPMDCVIPLVRCCTEKKAALLHVYRSVQREVFLRYLDRIVLHGITRYVDAVIETLSPAAVHEENKALLIKSLKCALVGVMLDWLDAGMEYDLLATVEKLCTLLNGFAQQAFLYCITLDP